MITAMEPLYQDNWQTWPLILTNMQSFLMVKQNFVILLPTAANKEPHQQISVSAIKDFNKERS